MLLSYDEMKKRFGVVVAQGYNSNSIGKIVIEEQFFLRESTYTVYASFEDAKDALYEEEQKRFERENARLNNIASVHNANKNFIVMIGKYLFGGKKRFDMEFRNACQKNENKKQESFKAISEAVFVELDKKALYDVSLPDFKIGDEGYIVVAKDNYLDIGIYKFKSVNVSRYNQMITIDAEVDGKPIRVSGKENDLGTGYTYHSVFMNYEEAKEYFNKLIDFQIEKLQNKKV